MTWLTHIEDALRSRPVREHAPAFRVVSGDDHWNVYDGPRWLATFRQGSLDIWAFSPFEPDELANPQSHPTVIDLHTARNTFLNFGMQGWPAGWRQEDLCWTWEQDRGSELRALVRLDRPDGDGCRWMVRISYDTLQSRYRYEIDIDARKVDPEGFECFNLMTAGALATRPAERRWTHALWENADGELRRIVHSNALFMCTDYGNLRRETGPWRTYHLSYPQAWIAYAAHPTFNPALLIHRTNVPLLGAKCSQLFDEHVLWSRAGQDQLQSDGLFHFRMSLEFVNLPAALAADLLSRAADPVRPSRWRDEVLALPLYMDQTNSFEQPVDPWQPQECPMVVVNGAEGNATWSAEAAHSGQRSLLLRQAGDGEVRLHPLGAVYRVRPNTRYRLSAWVKTAGVKQGAGLELTGFAYTYDNVLASARSGKLRGDQAWTLLEVDLDSGDLAYIMPHMVLEGPGSAWFDDVCLAAVPRPRDDEPVAAPASRTVSLAAAD